MRYVLRNTNQESRGAARSLAWLGLAQLLAACSLAPPPGRAITINLPQGSGSNTAAARVSQRSAPAVGGTTTTTAAVTSCYAINVTASDIPNSSNAACIGEPMGITAGFVSSSAGSITLAVPDGSARTFQLLEVDVPGAFDCTQLNLGSILNAITTSNWSALPNINVNPYVSGSTTTDIDADTTITIVASGPSATAQQLFQSCGGGGGSGYAPTVVYGAGNDLANPYGEASDSFAFPFRFLVPASLDGSDLTSSVTTNPPQSLSGTQAAQNVYPPNSDGVNPPVAAGQGVVESTHVPGQRAVMQVRWDTANWDLTNTPYAIVQLAIAGGIEEIGSGECEERIAEGPAQVSAAVWDQAAGVWLPLTQNQEGQMNGQPSFGAMFWNSGGGKYAPVPASDLVVTSTTDGHKYIVANVESNYISNGICTSSVHLADASVRLMSGPSADQNDDPNDQMSVTPVGTVQFSNCYNSVCTYTTVGGAIFGLAINGGTPPYRYALGGNQVGNLDLVSGVYKAPTTATAGITDTISVSDSAGHSAEITVNYVPPAVAERIAITDLSSGGTELGALTPIAAGSCVSITATAMAFGWLPVSASGDTASASLGSQSIDNYYTDNPCTDEGEFPVFTGTAVTFYTKIGGEQPGGQQLTVGAGSVPAGPGAPVDIIAGAAAQIAVSQAGMPLGGLKAVTEGYCQQILLSVQDIYGDDVPAGTGLTLSTTLGTTVGEVTLTSGCASGMASSLSISVTAGTPTAIYYKASSTGSERIAASTVSGPSGPYYFLETPSLLGNSNPLSFAVQSEGFTTQLIAVFPDNGGSIPATAGLAVTPGTPPTTPGCYRVEVALADSFGNFVEGANPSSVGANVGFYSDAACSSTSPSVVTNGVETVYIQYNGGTSSPIVFNGNGASVNSSAPFEF